MYYLNQYFDSKSGANASANIIAAIQSNHLFWPLLVPTEATEEEKQKIFMELNEDYNNIISGFYWGEYIDCMHNIWKRLKDSSLEEKLNSYDERAYYINTLFFQAIGNIARKTAEYQQKRVVDRRKFERLSRYSYCFGMGLQLVNDIADFVPPEMNEGATGKESTDSHNDIENGKMTPPIIYMLEMANQEDRKRVIDCLENGFNSPPEQLRQTTDIFIRSGAYSMCRRVCRKYKKECVEMARGFEESFHFLLNRSSLILDANRYFRSLTKLKNKKLKGDG